MYTDMFKMFSEQAQKSLAPYTKFNTLMAKHVEQITELQVNAMKAYSELGLAQFKAASEVKDVTSLASFNSQQMATLTKLSQQLMDDSGRIQTIAKTFKDDVEELTTENLKATKVA